jgi:hypothetical protein
MAEKDFETKLLRLVAAETFFLCSLNAAREMYGKSYFSLGVAEKQSLDQQVLSQIGGNFQSLTPEWFGEQPGGPTVGFHDQPKPEEKKVGS